MGGGGGKTCRAIWGGESTIERALQNQFWRPQKVGFAWPMPVSSKEKQQGENKRGGKRIIGGGGGGPKPLLGRGFYGMFSPPLSFPPPFVFLWNGAWSSKNALSGNSRLGAWAVGTFVVGDLRGLSRPKAEGMFSLRSCRRSSVILFCFFTGKLCEQTWREVLLDPQNKAQTIGGNFRVYFRKFVAHENISCQHSLCRPATLRKCCDPDYVVTGGLPREDLSQLSNKARYNAQPLRGYELRARRSSAMRQLRGCNR